MGGIGMFQDCIKKKIVGGRQKNCFSGNLEVFEVFQLKNVVEDYTVSTKFKKWCLI